MCSAPSTNNVRSAGRQLTINGVVAVLPPELAPMVVTPGAEVVAKPARLGALAIVATLATVELQCALRVTSWVVWSLKVPVAVNCCVAPADTDEFVGVISIETRVPVPMVSVVVPLTPKAEAVMVTEPTFFP